MSPTDTQDSPVEPSTNIISQVLEDEMKTSYLEYAMSVLLGRALPEVRDGLKPVQRRILFSMHELNLSSSKGTRKSARIVGDVIGKYHPHGDSAAYQALARLTQDFSMRYPLVFGQGNFGSIDGDSPAAQRYTEAKLNKLAEAMLEDIEKQTVNFVPNFDETEKEPEILPAKIPNLLVNGSTGIAVGMATSIPPHNLAEVCDAVLHTLKNPDAEVDELMTFVQGPDFPTAGVIMGRSGINAAYKNGKGRVTLRAYAQIEEKATKASIVITEIPFMTKKEELIVGIDECRKNKVISDITEVRDESDKDVGIRIVIELKSGAQKELVLNQLFKHTRLQVTFSIINLCIVNNVPRILNLKDFVDEFIKHRIDVITRKTQYDLAKAEEKAHLLAGLKIAVENIDQAIKIIRGSQQGQQAKQELMVAFELDDKQAQAILDMRLQRLTALEQGSIVDDYNKTMALIADLKSILENPQKVKDIVAEQTTQVKEQFGDNRRTQIMDAQADFEDEDLIEDQTVVISVTSGGFIKRVPIDTYKAQARGGKGIIGTTTKDEDSVVDMFTAHSKSYILCFSNTGQMYWLKSYKIPENSRTAGGRSIRNLLPLQEDEVISAYVPVSEFSEDKYLVLATKGGTIKKVALSAFSRPRQNGIRAINLEDDTLIGAEISDGQDLIMLATKNGIAACFKETDVRPMGRTAHGVRGIRLEEGDAVVSLIVPKPEQTLLTVTEHGFGKRTQLDQYRIIGRGGKGVINIQTTPRNGKVIAVLPVIDEDGLLAMSQNGIVMRTRADQISVIGRNTQGVRVMRVQSPDTVRSVAKIVQE